MAQPDDTRTSMISASNHRYSDAYYLLILTNEEAITIKIIINPDGKSVGSELFRYCNIIQDTNLVRNPLLNIQLSVTMIH